MVKKPHQVIFWLVIFIFLNVLFGTRWHNYLDSFYFTAMLLPVAIATSYFFNLFLVPRYLAKGKNLMFGLYTIYTVIVSTFLSMIIAMFTFVILADLKWKEVNPIIGDVFQLSVIIYFVTILFSFIRLYNSHLSKVAHISKLEEQQRKNELKALTVRSNRQTVNIMIHDIWYIESLADYVKIHTDKNTIVTKEKIGKLETTLPDQFIRIHRSFLIDKYKVEGFGHDHIHIHGQKLPLGRKYKKDALGKIRHA